MFFSNQFEKTELLFNRNGNSNIGDINFGSAIYAQTHKAKQVHSFDRGSAHSFLIEPQIAVQK